MGLLLLGKISLAEINLWNIPSLQTLSVAQINFAWIFLASLWQPRGFNIVVVQKVMTAIKRFNETPGKLNPYDHFFPCCLAKRTLMLSPVEVILDSLVDKPESKSQVRSPKRKGSEDFGLWLSLKSYVQGEHYRSNISRVFVIVSGPVGNLE